MYLFYRTRMRETVFHLIWAISALVAFSNRVSGQAKTKPVTTHLSAKWAHTPLLLETAEYMTEENLATFWGFIEAVAQTDPQLYTSKFHFTPVYFTLLLFMVCNQYSSYPWLRRSGAV